MEESCVAGQSIAAHVDKNIVGHKRVGKSIWIIVADNVWNLLANKACMKGVMRGIHPHRNACIVWSQSVWVLSRLSELRAGHSH